MPTAKCLVVGTHNAKKGRELVELLAPHGLVVRTLADYPQAIEVVEDGTTFADNARLKASQQARHLGEWVLADDSGIEVDHLAGAPGVFSARFAGEGAGDDANNRLLLAKLNGVADAQRGAGYYCHIALASPAGEIVAESIGRCRGRIVSDYRGQGGFGYDPLFLVREYHRTFGELGPAVKRAISHRSRALRAVLPLVLQHVG